MTPRVFLKPACPLLSFDQYPLGSHIHHHWGLNKYETHTTRCCITRKMRVDTLLSRWYGALSNTPSRLHDVFPTPWSLISGGCQCINQRLPAAYDVQPQRSKLHALVAANDSHQTRLPRIADAAMFLAGAALGACAT
jgi:hypothetical protein